MISIDHVDVFHFQLKSEFKFPGKTRDQHAQGMASSAFPVQTLSILYIPAQATPCPGSRPWRQQLNLLVPLSERLES